MDLTAAILDPTILDEGYTMGALWLMLENLRNLREEFGNLKEQYLSAGYFENLEVINTKLNHIEFNIDMVEMTMMNKETLSFIHLDGEEEPICLN